MNKNAIGLTLLVVMFTYWLCFPLETKNEALANSDPVRNSSNPDQNEFFVSQIKYASKHYKEFGRVDEQRMHWAPTLCRAPIGVDLLKSAHARVSESDDPISHGGKLYFMFANHRASYIDLKQQQPFGQILVKESWTSEAMDDDFRLDAGKHKMWDKPSGEKDDQERILDDTIAGGFIPYAQKEGQWFKADKKNLFVMIKLAPGTEGSDHGWIYGTVNIKGDVTSSGKIQSCINCHESSKKDRMFGLPVAMQKDNRKPEQ